MRQSEYTQYYERISNVKCPVRGKLFMIHRGRSIYINTSDGRLTDAVTGMKIPKDVAVRRDSVADWLDLHWELLLGSCKAMSRLQWRSWQGGVYRVNGKVIKRSPFRSIPY